MSNITLLVAPNVLAGIYAALQGDDVPKAQRDAIYAALQNALRPTVRWASPRPGLHVIDGAVLESDLASIDAAFCACGAPGRRLVRAADFASPDAAPPAASVRGAFGRAAKALHALNPRLADAVASIRVEGGWVVYRATGAIDIDCRQLP